MEAVARWYQRPEFGFAATVGGRLAVSWQFVEGALEWLTLVLGVVIGMLTVVRLLTELGVLPERRRRERRRVIRPPRP